jgi:hypothetical protein
VALAERFLRLSTESVLTNPYAAASSPARSNRNRAVVDAETT